MNRIPAHEVKFHPHSFADPAGRLFWWDGQLYRGISHEKASFFKQLFQTGIIQELVDRGLLIETEPTPLTVDGYAMVVRHRSVPFASYPEEWCTAMLKDAALANIELLTRLAQYSFTLKDAHPWNILFDAWKPVYIDLSSIIPMNDDAKWPGYDEFCRFYLYPLILMSHKQERIARRLLPEYEGVLKSDLLRLTQCSALSASITSVMCRLTSTLRQKVPQINHRLLKIGLQPLQSLLRKQSHSRDSYLALLEKMRREVEGIPLPSFETEGLGHDGNSIPSLSPQDSWTTKQRALHKILAELRPGSVLDIGSNTGWYSKLAVLFGNRTVSFDINSLRVTQLYYDARNNKLPILPLVMDFTDPTPSRGLSSHWSIAATERFRCDTVMALALVHQIVFKRSLNFDQIVDGLALFSKRWLVVEFVPPEDEEIRKRWSRTFAWYTLDNFIDTLRRRFHSVIAVPSHPKPRVLLFCEK